MMLPTLKRYGMAVLIVLLAGVAMLLVGTGSGLLYGFVEDIIAHRFQGSIPANSSFKLLMAPPFLAAALMAYLYPGRITGGFRWRGHLFAPFPRSTPSMQLAVLLAVLFLLPVGGQALASILETITFRIHPDRETYQELIYLLGPTGHWLDTLGAFLTIGIVGPICEELIFRGFLLRYLLRSGANIHAAIFFQAILFGAIHGNLYQFSYAWPLGVLFGYMTVYSGFRGSTIYVHCATNIFAVMAMYGMIPMLPSEPVPGEFLPRWFTVGGTCLFFTGVLLFFVAMPRMQTRRRIKGIRPARTEQSPDRIESHSTEWEQSGSQKTEDSH